jgi:hypothetical protein
VCAVVGVVVGIDVVFALVLWRVLLLVLSLCVLLLVGEGVGVVVMYVAVGVMVGGVVAGSYLATQAACREVGPRRRQHIGKAEPTTNRPDDSCEQCAEHNGCGTDLARLPFTNRSHALMRL